MRLYDVKNPKITVIVWSFICCWFEWHLSKHSLSEVQNRLDAYGKDKQFCIMKMCTLNSFSQ